MRVNVDHSEWGTCNSQFSKSIQGVDLNTSGGIRIGQGYNPVQLQDLTLCGSVTAGRQSLKFIKFKNIFDLHRSPVCRERIWLRAPYLLCVRYITVPSDPVIGKTWACIVQPQQSVKYGGKYRKIYRECGSILTILRGVHVTASSPKVFKVQISILQEVFVWGRATILYSYKICPYAGQSQRDGKV